MEIITYMDNRKTSFRPQAKLVRKQENALRLRNINKFRR